MVASNPQESPLDTSRALSAREPALERALGSMRLEGFEPTAFGREQLQRVAAGEITFAQAQDLILHHHRV